MTATFEYVNHPSEFEHKFLRDMVGVPNIDQTVYSPFFSYLAVFDKEVNYPGEKFKELLDENYPPKVIVAAILTQRSHRQYGFGIGDYDCVVDTWIFASDAIEKGKRRLDVVTVIEVTTVSV